RAPAARTSRIPNKRAPRTSAYFPSRSCLFPSEKQVVQHPLECLVADPKKNRHHQDECKYRRGRLDRLLARGPYHLLHFGPGLEREAEELLAGRGQPGHRRAEGDSRRHREQPQHQRGVAQPVEAQIPAPRRTTASASLALSAIDVVFSVVIYSVWQGQRASNPQPSVLETDALPIELCP